MYHALKMAYKKQNRYELQQYLVTSILSIKILMLSDIEKFYYFKVEMKLIQFYGTHFILHYNTYVLSPLSLR
jgi:hypothetical protein